MSTNARLLARRRSVSTVESLAAVEETVEEEAFVAKEADDEEVDDEEVDESFETVEEEDLAQKISSLKYTEESRQKEARVVLEIKLIEND